MVLALGLASMAAAQPAPQPPTLPPAIIEAYGRLQPAAIFALQEDLVWARLYGGPVDGIFNPKTHDAVRAFQQRLNRPVTGLLEPAERAQLTRAADERRTQIGWRLVDDRASESRVGLPMRLLSAPRASAGRSVYAAADGTLRIEVFRLPETNVDLAQMFEREKAPTATRKPTYSILRPDFFAIGGTDGTRAYDTRVVVRDGVAKGILAVYDPKITTGMQQIFVMMAGTFQPFGATAPTPAPAPGPAPVATSPLDRPLEALPMADRNLLYGTALVVSADGDLIASARLTERCDTIAIGRLGYAARVAAMPDADVALLRVFGQSSLVALNLGAGGWRVGEAVTIAARAHPARRVDTLETVTARIEDTRPDGRALIAFPFASGHHGGAVLNGQGQLAGMLTGVPQRAAGQPPQAVAVGGEKLAAFLAGQRRPGQGGAAPVLVAAAPSTMADAIVPLACVLKK
jgi:hypothetical protein